MEIKNKVLTKKEREILILCAENPNCIHFGNDKIAQRLGISVNNLKVAIHRICTKLGTHSRNEAIIFALKNGEIGLSDLCSTLDEVAVRFKSLGPDMLLRIAQFMRREIDYNYFMDHYKETIHNNRKEDAILTQSERDVLILVGYGLTNKEIADRLCMSISSVRTFIYRACAKLGVPKRADAVILAVKKGEIDANDLFSPDDLLRMFISLDADTIEEVAQLLEVKQKRGQNHIPVPV